MGSTLLEEKDASDRYLKGRGKLLVAQYKPRKQVRTPTELREKARANNCSTSIRTARLSSSRNSSEIINKSDAICSGGENGL